MDIHLTRIDNKSAVPSSKKTSLEQAPEKVETTPSAAAPVDETSLKLTSLAATVENLPIIDEARVERVRNALQSGHYRVDAQKLADKIIAFEKQLP